MCEALSLVKNTLETWLAEHPRGFPPTVLHLTDGESSDGDPDYIGRQIMSLKTDDGNVLLFNCHLRPAPPEDRISNATYRCRMDSRAPCFKSPAGCRKVSGCGGPQSGVQALDGSRGFVFNGDPSSIVQFYEIGTKSNWNDAVSLDGRQNGDCVTSPVEITTPQLQSANLLLPKMAHRLSECEDAVGIDATRHRFAIADGATEAFDARNWAQRLAQNRFKLKRRCPSQSSRSGWLVKVATFMIRGMN
jgi:hypothetical protein